MTEPRLASDQRRIDEPAAPRISRRWQAIITLFAVLLLRVPFLNQAIQGDDIYYLKGAEHAQIDPLHPTHAKYVFQGREVDMRGHPHPPLNSWVLGALLAASGDVYEIEFHAVYIVFSLIAAFSMLALARRFCERPLLATALFLVSPAFVVNGNSLEADLPFLAFWMAAIAFFLAERYGWSALVAALAALAAYQAVILTPILAGWLIIRRERKKVAWLATFSAPALIVAWQAYERVSSGSLPVAVLAGYMSSDNLQALAQKIRNAVALTGHLGWIIFPLLAIAAFRRAPRWAYLPAGAAALGAAFYDPNPLFWFSCGTGVWVLTGCIGRLRHADANVRFLAWWVLVFFAAALVIFFAGSARYLLPAIAPAAILVARRTPVRWIYAGIAAEALLSGLLAIVNYQHWGGYREFARQFGPDMAHHRTWTNAEWGLRFYLESEGALPVVHGTPFRAGDLIVSDVYSGDLHAGSTALLADGVITSAIPLRIVAPGARSGYSSTMFGLRPFDFSRQPIDRLRAELVSEQKPELSWLRIGTPQAAAQIVSGVYNNDRWMSGSASVLLKEPADANRLEAIVFVPQQARARKLRLYINGMLLTEKKLPGPGQYHIAAPVNPASGNATVNLEVDATFSAPSDQRELGIVLLEVGFR
jgi:hypothetical protein